MDIPVIFQADDPQIDRVLSRTGKRVLHRTIEHAQQVVKEQKWPAKQIVVAYHQDSEDDAEETITVAPVIRGPVAEPYACLNQYIKKMAALSRSMKQSDQEILWRTIRHGLTVQQRSGGIYVNRKPSDL